MVPVPFKDFIAVGASLGEIAGHLSSILTANCPAQLLLISRQFVHPSKELT
jgi:hypothetical protein